MTRIVRPSNIALDLRFRPISTLGVPGRTDVSCPSSADKPRKPRQNVVVCPHSLDRFGRSIGVTREGRAEPIPGSGEGTPMANVLSLEERVAVISHLVEGASVRATSRLTGTCKEAILSLLVRIGEGCDRLHNRIVRDLDIREIQCD